MKTIGIMVEKVDPALYLMHQEAAAAAGFDQLAVFSPDKVSLTERTVLGFVYRKGLWVQTRTALPGLIYDIGNYADRKLAKIAGQVKKLRGVEFVGDWLGNNKWKIHQYMSSSNILNEHLIPTRLFSSVPVVLEMLDQHGKLIMKPVGSHDGIGINRLSYQHGKYVLEQNGHPPAVYSGEEIGEVLQRMLRGSKYIVQKWVDIRDRKNRVYDIRVLMQKDESGHWELTGMGVRRGQKGKITSNLATGASAHNVLLFLTRQFGGTRALAMKEKLRTISHTVSSHLEAASGKRLVELGLDYGVDRSGYIWIIEANTKPGKQVIRSVCSPETYRRSQQLPIWYAWYLTTK